MTRKPIGLSQGRRRLRAAATLVLSLIFLIVATAIALPRAKEWRSAASTAVWGATLPRRVSLAMAHPVEFSGGWAIPTGKIRQCPDLGAQSGRPASSLWAALSDSSASAGKKPGRFAPSSALSLVRTCIEGEQAEQNDQAQHWLEANQRTLSGARSRFDGRLSSSPFEVSDGPRVIHGQIVSSASPALAASRQSSAGQRPVAVCVSGLSMQMDYCSWSAANILAPQGWTTVVFDPVGIAPASSSTGGTMSDMSAVTEERDLTAVLRYLRSQQWVDSGRIALVGGSQGGLASVLETHDHPRWVWRLALAYPAVQLSGLVRSIFGRQSVIPHQIKRGAFSLGRRYATDLWNLDPWGYLPTISQKTLIVQGTADKIVDPSVSYRAAGSIPDARLVLIEGAGHGLDDSSRTVGMARVAQFLQE